MKNLLALALLASFCAGSAAADVRVQLELRHRWKIRPETITFTSRTDAGPGTTAVFRESADGRETKSYPTAQVSDVVERLVRLSMTPPAPKERRCRQKITVTSELATRVFCRSEARRNFELRSALADLERLP